MTRCAIEKTRFNILLLTLILVLAFACVSSAQAQDVRFYWAQVKSANSAQIGQNLSYTGYIGHYHSDGREDFKVIDGDGHIQVPVSGAKKLIKSEDPEGFFSLTPSREFFYAKYELEPGVYRWYGNMGDEKGSFAGEGKFEVLEKEDGVQRFYLARAHVNIGESFVNGIGYSIDLVDYFNEPVEPYSVNYYNSDKQELGLINKSYLLIEREPGKEYVLNGDNDLTSSDVVGQAYRYQIRSLHNEEEVAREGLIFWKPLDPEAKAIGGVSGTLSPHLPDGISQQSSIQASIKILPSRELSINITKGAKVLVYHKLWGFHFRQFLEFKPTSLKNAGDYDIYTFSIPQLTSLHYEAFGDTVLREAQSFFIKPDADRSRAFNISVDVEPLDNHWDDNGVNSYADADIYLNTDDSRFIELAEGETFDLFPLRVMQAQIGAVTNYFTEPDYHFEIINTETGASKILHSREGGSVREGSIELKTVGARGKEEYRITGVSPGLSVIKITYDAIKWRSSIGQTAILDHENKKYSSDYFNPIEPNCTAVVIVNVGGADSSGITTNIEEGEDDTIYFPDTETSVDYTFAPVSTLGDVAVRVLDPLHNTEWGKGWTDYGTQASGTSFTVQLKDGRNIVEVKSGSAVKYHTIYAKAVFITITNETRPNEPFRVGDTVNIHFKGLKTPIQKLAGIYNPGVMKDPNGGTALGGYSLDNVCVVYDMDGREITSNKTQYMIREGMTVRLKIEKIGETVLSNGRIRCPFLGDVWGRHRRLGEDGVPPSEENATFPGGPLDHSTLSDIVLTAAAASEPAPDPEEKEPEPKPKPVPEPEPITPIPAPEPPVVEPEPPVVVDPTPDPVTPPEQPEPEIDDSDEEAPAVVVPLDPEKDVKLDKDTGTETVTVPDGALESLLDQAIAVAKEAGSREPTVEIRVDAPASDAETGESVTVRKVEIKIPIGDLIAVRDSKVENVKIVSPAGEVTLNTEALRDLIAKAEAEPGSEKAPTVDIVIAKGEDTLAEAKDLTEKQEEALKDEKIREKVREVFDVSVYAGSERIEDFETKAGKLTVGLPYALKDGETKDGVWVRYVKKDGTTEDMVDGRRYDEKKKLAVFQTSHLSVYAIVYEYEETAVKEEEPAEEPAEESAKGGGGCDAGVWGGFGGFVGFGGFGLLALACAALAAAKRGPAKR